MVFHQEMLTLTIPQTSETIAFSGEDVALLQLQRYRSEQGLSKSVMYFMRLITVTGKIDSLLGTRFFKYEV